MAKGSKTGVHTFDRFKLDAEKLMLYRDEIEITLPPKIIKTLVVLIENRGSILSKDELIELVWDDSIVEESNLSQNLYVLRKTLGTKPDGSQYIETLRRRGYRFTANVQFVEHSSESSNGNALRAHIPRIEVHREGNVLRLVDGPKAEDVDDIIPDLKADASATIRPRSWYRYSIAFVCVIAALGIGYWFYGRLSTAPQIQSVAVLPFQNVSGDPDIEYLTDGMTETLINSLSQLPQMSVKARSTVFRYKGKEVEPQAVANELTVQAILQGRVMHRGDDLTLFLSLVDGKTGDQLWGEQYQRKLTDLLSLQSEIARDVSRKLRVRLAGTDEQKVAKNYTEDVEAYQLYLKGRYHFVRLTPSEIQRSISYFEQAIAHDNLYALAYVGLADAYRSRPISSDVPPKEFLSKAKAAVQKALEIDDTLAEAHAVLGFTIFWYEWNWNEAENQFKRALELNPNSANTHLYYSHLLSQTGRHPEALSEIQRALELDPLSIYANALGAQFLLHSGQIDQALASLEKTFELEPNYWLAHLFASSSYTEKGMYPEAIAAARRSKELMPESSHPTAFGAYALAKSGKRVEAQAMLDELIRTSTERYVPPYLIALIFNSLDKSDESFAWLERGYEIRDPRMVFLNVEPKWNNLRSDPRFQDLLRRIGFTP